jgi:hypothetical protein
MKLALSPIYYPFLDSYTCPAPEQPACQPLPVSTRHRTVKGELHARFRRAPLTVLLAGGGSLVEACSLGKEVLRHDRHHMGW